MPSNIFLQDSFAKAIKKPTIPDHNTHLNPDKFIYVSIMNNLINKCATSQNGIGISFSNGSFILCLHTFSEETIRYKQISGSLKTTNDKSTLKEATMLHKYNDNVVHNFENILWTSFAFY